MVSSDSITQQRNLTNPAISCCFGDISTMPVLPKPISLIAWFRYLLLCTLMLGALPVTWAASSSQSTPTPADTRLPPAPCAPGQSWSASMCVTSKLNAPQAFGSSFAGPRSNYRLSKTANGVVVKDANTGISVDLVAPTSLQFADVSVNLQIGAMSDALSADTLQTLIELYVAFFNRLPDANGLAYWMGQYNAGMSLDAIADSFYANAISPQFSSLTGYSSSMSHADFVRIIYANVLGRSAPPESDVQYWASQLASGTRRGSMLSTMLKAAHNYAADATWSWVSQLLDNKVTLARISAIEQGYTYNSPEQSLRMGMSVAAAVTPSSIDAAYNLIGIVDTGWNNLAPYNPNPKLESITPAAVKMGDTTLFTITGQDLTANTVMYLGGTQCPTVAGSNSSTSFQARCSARAAGGVTAEIYANGRQADGRDLIDKKNIVTCFVLDDLINGLCYNDGVLVTMTDSHGQPVVESTGGDATAAGLDGDAGDGAPIVNALVTLVDKTGRIATTKTNATGYYRVSISGMTPPFVVSVNRSDNTTTWQSIHPGPVKLRGFITANMTALTDKIVTDVLLGAAALKDGAAGDGNIPQRMQAVRAIKAEGVSAVGSEIARLTPAELEMLLKAAKADLNQQLAAQLAEVGLNPASFDPITTPFHAVLTDPYDQLLERVTVIKDPGTGGTAW